MVHYTGNIDYANELFAQALDLHLQKNFREAIEVYSESIRVFPTPEAYTYRGWSYSKIGDFEHAIADCESAIDLDPEYGNPYNDLGSYLISLKRYEEAIIWLEKALTASRYNSRHFPLYNLGRLYEIKGEWFLAMDYFRRALEMYPDFIEAKTALLSLIGKTN